MRKIKLNTIQEIDCLQGLRKLPENSIQCCVTSPPYWRLRDYGVVDQLGMEATPELYVAAPVKVFDQVRRVLKPDGTLWLNLGDVYWGSGKAGNNPTYQKRHKIFGRTSDDISHYGKPVTGRHQDIKPKDMTGLPWMVAFALRKNGWWLRQDIIWHKPSTMPESITDRCTKAHEYVFLLAKNRRYYFDHTASRLLLRV